MDLAARPRDGLAVDAGLAALALRDPRAHGIPSGGRAIATPRRASSGASSAWSRIGTVSIPDGQPLGAGRRRVPTTQSDSNISSNKLVAWKGGRPRSTRSRWLARPCVAPSWHGRARVDAGRRRPRRRFAVARRDPRRRPPTSRRGQCRGGLGVAPARAARDVAGHYGLARRGGGSPPRDARGRRRWSGARARRARSSRRGRSCRRRRGASGRHDVRRRRAGIPAHDVGAPAVARPGARTRFRDRRRERVGARRSAPRGRRASVVRHRRRGRLPPTVRARRRPHDPTGSRTGGRSPSRRRAGCSSTPPWTRPGRPRRSGARRCAWSAECAGGWPRGRHPRAQPDRVGRDDAGGYSLPTPSRVYAQRATSPLGEAGYS